MPKNKDGYYRSTFVVGKTAEGKSERVTVRGKTKKELDEKLAEAKQLHARGIDISGITMYTWTERWMAVYKANASDTQKAQKNFLGHSSTDVTDIYRKMNETAFARARALINEYYAKIYSGTNISDVPNMCQIINV